MSRAGRSATVLAQFSRPPRANDDLLTLVVEQVCADQRAGCSGAERKNIGSFQSTSGQLAITPAPSSKWKGLSLEVSLGADAAISRILFLSLRPTVSTSCTAEPRLANSSPEVMFQHATHRASVMARSGRRPAAPRSSEPQRCRSDFLPLGFAHSSREPRKHAPAKAGVAATASSAALRPFGCVADRPRPQRSPSRPRWSRA